jgi:hypothetical protein
MSYTAITKAVANVVMDAKLSVIDDLITFLENKIEVDDDLKGFFHEFKMNLKECEEKKVKDAGKKTTKGKKSNSDEPKKKRKPSVFNLYVKDVMPDMKAKHPDIKDGKKMMGFASESWKNDPMGVFIKNKVAEMKAEDNDADVVEMFALAKALFKGEPVEEKKVVSDENESDEEKENESDEEKEKEKENESDEEKEKESDEEKREESDEENENEKPLKKTSPKKNKVAKKEKTSKKASKKASKKSVAKKDDVVVKESSENEESDDE